MFSQFGVFAAMFAAAGKLMEDYWSMKMDHVMAGLMGIMFAAMQAGSAVAFGPDMGKATIAA